MRKDRQTDRQTDMAKLTGVFLQLFVVKAQKTNDSYAGEIDI
jgi:hypothetical protein